MKFYHRIIVGILLVFAIGICLFKLKQLKKYSYVGKRNKFDYDFEEGADDDMNNVPTKKVDNKLLDVGKEIERLRLRMNRNFSKTPNEVFREVHSWVTPREIYPHNHNNLMAQCLHLMASLKIVHADVLRKGTQLKLLFTLEGGQKVVFKQKRYSRDYVVQGNSWDGFDRHNAEIASFHLTRVLDMRRSPLVVGRVVDLRDVLKVASDALKNTFSERDGKLCYYGACYYCKDTDEMRVCSDDNYKLEGSITLWLPPEYSQFTKSRHPYQRTYKKGKKAYWETDDQYCNNQVKHKPPYDKGEMLLDVTDASVFDYLIGNGDRHHYETFKNKKDSMLVMLDNAKSFGNPELHDSSILAPLKQCCILRNTTYNRLIGMQNGILTHLLRKSSLHDPLFPLLHQDHMRAIEYRLKFLLNEIGVCIENNGIENVIINKWIGIT